LVVRPDSPIRGFGSSLDLIQDLLNRGRGIEAENVARALLARVEAIAGPDSLEAAQVIDLLSRAVRRSSRVPETEKMALAERALAIKEKSLGPSHVDVATSLTNLAIERTLTGDPGSGKPLLERALTIREAAFGSSHPAVAATLQSLAGLLMVLRDDAGATALLERALRILETTHGPDNLETIKTLVRVATFYEEREEGVTARRRSERALWLGEWVLGANPPLVSEVLLRLAVVVGNGAGDYATAASLNKRLVAGVEQKYGSDDA